MNHADLLKKWCVALTGGIATGKSTVANDLRRLGYIVIDADRLARDVVEPNTVGFLRINTRYGERVIREGVLDRRALRAIVFDDPDERVWLENTLHPLIEQAFKCKLTYLGLEMAPRLFFYESALIHERGQADNFMEVWCTMCSRGEQMKRLKARDNTSEADAAKIFQTQIPMVEKAQMSTRILYTDRPTSILMDEVDHALKEMRLKQFRHATCPT